MHTQLQLHTVPTVCVVPDVALDLLHKPGVTAPSGRRLLIGQALG